VGFRELRKEFPIEEFDYQLLISYLSEYANPRGKVQRLIRDGKILRVKKGLYVFGPDFRKGTVCKESLANLIYGPSYISYQYALSYYGMIPEKVAVVTSATTGKSKRFDTPIGSFSYRHVDSRCFSTGVTSLKLDNYHTPLIATAEKALIDQLMAEKGLERSFDVASYLYEDLRIESSALKALSLERFYAIAEACPRERVYHLVEFLKNA